MKKICISKEWLFTSPETKNAVTVDLPHDYSISLPRDPKAAGNGRNGYFTGSTGKYVKYMTPENAKHIILDIDGAYMCAEIKINGDLIAVHPHGYTPFLAELTDKIRPGKINKIEISTNNIQPSTRWYSGAGIYRDVFLWTGNEVRIEPWDMFVTTPQADKTAAKVVVKADVASDIDAQAMLKITVTDAEGKKAASASESITVRANKKTPAEIALEVKEPELWDTENPCLYNLTAEIITDGNVIDTAETVFGIRTIEADAERGFLLNGKPMKLRGGCIHHDHGALGAAAFPAAEERKIKLLRQAGFNAVRTAHYPPSLALLEACDRMGMIVMDEAFDMWNNGKTACDYHLWFADWWARDISYMVLRDRNHPSVISYSIGNEIWERNGNSDGAAWAEKLSNEIRKYDSTRFVTSGVCGMWAQNGPDENDPEEYAKEFYKDYPDFGDGKPGSSWDKRTEAYMKPLDIVGYNYLYERYAQDHKTYPKRVIWGSETHAIHFYDSWKAVTENSHVIGDFTWTAYDNLGEAGTGRALWARDGVIEGISIADYPWRTCWQGDLDLCGYRRPQSYFREAVWIGNTEPRIFTTHPEHYGEGFTGTEWHWYDVAESWTFDDKYIGKPVKAEVYTDADKIVFYLNGKEIGEAVPEKGIASIDVLYEKGELCAAAYKNGRETGRSSLFTVGKPAAVKVKAEQDEFCADNRDLCYFDITVTDENGSRVPYAENELSCVVDGGELMCIFSGNPKSTDRYTSPICHAFDGRALAVVRANKQGKVKITVGGKNLKSGEACAAAK